MASALESALVLEKLNKVGRKKTRKRSTTGHKKKKTKSTRSRKWKWEQLGDSGFIQKVAKANYMKNPKGRYVRKTMENLAKYYPQEYERLIATGATGQAPEFAMQQNVGGLKVEEEKRSVSPVPIDWTLEDRATKAEETNMPEWRMVAVGRQAPGAPPKITRPAPGTPWAIKPRRNKTLLLGNLPSDSPV